MAPNLLLCASLQLVSSSATIALSFKQTLLRWYDASRITDTLYESQKPQEWLFEDFLGFSSLITSQTFETGSIPLSANPFSLFSVAPNIHPYTTTAVTPLY